MYGIYKHVSLSCDMKMFITLILSLWIGTRDEMEEEGLRGMNTAVLAPPIFINEAPHKA